MFVFAQLRFFSYKFFFIYTIGNSVKSYIAYITKNEKDVTLPILNPIRVYYIHMIIIAIFNKYVQ